MLKHWLFGEHRECSRLGVHKRADARGNSKFNAIVHAAIVSVLAVQEMKSYRVDRGAASARSRRHNRMQSSEGDRSAKLSIRKHSNAIKGSCFGVQGPRNVLLQLVRAGQESVMENRPRLEQS